MQMWFIAVFSSLGSDIACVDGTQSHNHSTDDIVTIFFVCLRWIFLMAFFQIYYVQCVLNKLILMSSLYCVYHVDIQQLTHEKWFELMLFFMFVLFVTLTSLTFGFCFVLLFFQLYAFSLFDVLFQCFMVFLIFLRVNCFCASSVFFLIVWSVTSQGYK